MIILSVGAVSLSGFLAYSAIQLGEVVGCTADGVWDCGHVMHSRWSKVLGIPVSVPAAALYLVLITALVLASRRMPLHVQKTAWGIVTMTVISAGAAAIWFMGLQAFVLGHLCQYCVPVHIIGLTLCGLILWKSPLGRGATSGLSGLGLAGVACLIAVQLMTEPPKTFAIETYEPIATPAGENLAAEDATEAEDVFAAPGDDLFAAPEISAPGELAPTEIAPAAENKADTSEPADDAVAEARPTPSLSPQP
ncbi:MAG: vitamin K epoxide reductase family protein, partial [Planctomycetales bacterium]|nr:vitamin K epoxide reductase family protein [Planctomycetales bacterium]